jgi:hypothetical protein
MEVFVEEKSSFPFYCHAMKGKDTILAAMSAALKEASFECESGDDDA